ncbi:DUF2235 domain-containing protein [Methylococcus sp. EFPC2]|uniref:DUF2235 domain-containing protein n=1 Tax=Methylococcus sp. EFPC2 TaxID=2812648 RepID=UPI0019680197|nr:DUF2235 domain-containing protein [Methylococcus sp. EFPC2]QSA97799.1 DUF2235 domain-containing protein [Methylococcus sp. EFPC2]
MSTDIVCETADRPKNIVVFCDGTWNTPNEQSKGIPCPTNVAKLFEAVYPFDATGNPQIVTYIRGVGTRTWERIRGGGFGYGISDNVKEGYKFICSNYQPGDRVFLFGFSRGAFTARSIAGFIHNLGILKRAKFYLIDEAYDHYRDTAPDWRPGSESAEKFQADHGWPEKSVHFLGVWDTVGALGAPYGVVIGWIIDKLFKCSFHDTKLSATIRSAAHAVAIDEQRWPFRPTLWELSSSHDPADFEERWFPGVHSDVGGGYAETGLADVALDWMAQKACARGLCLDLNKVTNPAVNPNPHESQHDTLSIGYRLPTILLVKIPAVLGFVLPKTTREELTRVGWAGNYRRAITAGAATGYQVESLTKCCAADASRTAR